ncbi:MAG: SAM-dependent DNA methyltransferase [Rhizobiaceae bacterium]|nr:SAM-dependent DNA methyltransferase [Rhizobiaceae bacterium]
MNRRDSTAVMARRANNKQALDFFPTPPWAVRALVEEVLRRHLVQDSGMTCWEPACGAGHAAIPLQRYFRSVHATDVADWGFGDRRNLDFTFCSAADAPWPVDWVITNPPFNIAEQFFDRAYSIARVGVALLVRLQWLESEGRYNRIFGTNLAPHFVCPFADRVPMIEGAWDPEASSATAYAWFVWIRDEQDDMGARLSQIQHIRPGASWRYSRLGDEALASPGEAARRKRQRKAAEG